MVLRLVGCTLLGAWVGAVVGLLMALPVLAVTWGASIPVLIAVGGAAGGIASLVATTETPGRPRRGAGQWLGAAFATAASVVAYFAFAKSNPLSVKPNELVFILVMSTYTAGVGFVAGRYAERSARSAATKP